MTMNPSSVLNVYKKVEKAGNSIKSPYEIVKKVTNRERSVRSDLKRLLAKKPVKKDSSALTLLSSLGFPDHCYEETDLGASVQISEGGRRWLPLVWSTNDDLGVGTSGV